MKLKRRVVSFINYIKFIYFLSKGIFGNDSPDTILKVIKKFLALEAPYYPQTILLSRSTSKSAELLGFLISSYLRTKSEITLNQIIEVLKEEFIKRDTKKNGRK